jgi:hypothetical protein
MLSIIEILVQSNLKNTTGPIHAPHNLLDFFHYICDWSLLGPYLSIPSGSLAPCILVEKFLEYHKQYIFI